MLNTKVAEIIKIKNLSLLLVQDFQGVLPNLSNQGYQEFLVALLKKSVKIAQQETNHKNLYLCNPETYLRLQVNRHLQVVQVFREQLLCI